MIPVFSARSRVAEDIQDATVTDIARMHALTSQTTQTSHVCALPLMAPCGRGMLAPCGRKHRLQEYGTEAEGRY